MNSSQSKIRHIRQANILLEQRRFGLMEQTTTSVTHPWLGADGNPDPTLLVTKMKTDPNFQNWLGELKTKTKEELEKAYKDIMHLLLKTKGNYDENYRAWLIAKATINDAIKMVGDSPETLQTISSQQASQQVQSQTAPTELAGVNPQPVTSGGEKINTTFDKAYDYKFENGKYYFKGKEKTQYANKYPNWVEATGKGLESIKSKIKF
jgi:hypothetical protein